MRLSLSANASLINIRLSYSAEQALQRTRLPEADAILTGSMGGLLLLNDSPCLVRS